MKGIFFLFYGARQPFQQYASSTVQGMPYFLPIAKPIKKMIKNKTMRKLSVNINKIATLRNARGKNTPDILEMTKRLISAGAESITVHPRPDERHIRYRDVSDLKNLLKTYHGAVEFNIEGYPSEKFLRLMEDTVPTQCTLVPDPPNVLTSNAGWNLNKNKEFLKKVIKRLNSLPMRVSLFVDPAKEIPFPILKDLTPHRIELYTEAYGETWNTPKQNAVLKKYKDTARRTVTLNMGVNAGHDLNQHNLPDLLQAVPEILEVSIGQALISDCLIEGVEKTLKSYLKIVKG